ncbi:hypothetical protein [Desulfitibacter alkalitolerans]|uniref:hypothetical protein n=1 Tax=Desulfitibacter alkalitolerans TaxID=264641 RepID=UPI000488F27D|nr:hypothetical protein [Desulfitibacter alkalitolerans]
MQIAELLLENINLTVVFRELDKDLVRRDIIKGLFTDEQLQIAEVPEILIVNFKDRKAQAIYSDRRLFINTQYLSSDETSSFLATSCNNFLEAVPGAEIVSYGFNIEGICKTPDFDYNQHLLEACFAGGYNLSKKINSDIIAVSPGFSFNIKEAKFSINFLPIEEVRYSQVDFKCNIHFDKVTPTSELIIKQFPEYLGYLKEVLEKL